jgi:hypothetical protein
MQTSERSPEGPGRTSTRPVVQHSPSVTYTAGLPAGAPHRYADERVAVGRVVLVRLMLVV